MRLRSLALAIIIASAANCDEAACFLKDGDRVGFFGDSITEAKAYGNLTEQVFRHFHPQAKVGFVNNGHSGLQLAGTRTDTVVAGGPNVITIMIGMNDAINGSWVRGMPMEPVVGAYRTRLAALVHELKGLGKEVVIMTPTLTDESAAMSCFRTEGTRALLTAMGRACLEVARAEAVTCVDVQGEFERYEATLPRFAELRPDGVHPCARGHYQIARTLWTQLGLAGSLEGGRGATAAAPELEVGLSLASNILPVGSDALEFAITSPTPGPATVTWSLGALRGSEQLTLAAASSWTLRLPKTALPQADGTSASLVLDLASHGARKVFVVDVFRKPVIHGRDGEATGAILDAAGGTACTYRFRKDGRRLLFEATVKKQELIQGDEAQYPWGTGDALTLYLDLRRGPALGGLGFDGDVFQVWFRPQDKPFFSPGFHPWSGRHMANIATDFGARTPDGYTVGLQLAGYINLKERFDVSDRDVIGFDLSLVNATALGKQNWINAQRSDRQNFLFPGTFALIDLHGKLTGESVLSASVFPDTVANP